jgi:ABC-type glycerol-3-phosphate transport system substrate-binding protein
MDWKLSRRDTLKIGGAAAGAALLPKARSARAADTTLTFWNGTYSFQDPADKSKDTSQFYIYQAIDRYQTANPGIKIEMENLATDPTMFVKYRTASVAQNGPDFASMWSGTYFLSMKDFIEPLGPYFTAEEKARILGWASVVEDFDPNNPNIYGVPSGSDGCVCFFYNKELMAAAGVDPAASWPQDFEGFVATLEQIKATGKTPMGLENYGYLWHLLIYWIAQTVGGSTGVGELGSGARKFNDPALVDIVTKWQTLTAYTAEGAETMTGTDADHGRCLDRERHPALDGRESRDGQNPEHQHERPDRQRRHWRPRSRALRFELLRAQRRSSRLHQVPDESRGAGVQGAIRSEHTTECHRCRWRSVLCQ